MLFLGNMTSVVKNHSSLQFPSEGRNHLHVNSISLKILFIHLTASERAQARGAGEGEGEAGPTLSRDPNRGPRPGTLGS